VIVEGSFENMKVALISSGLIRVPPTRGGAIEEYVFQLTQSLRKLGIDATAFDRAFSGDKTCLVGPLIRIRTPEMPRYLPRKDFPQELSFGLSSVRKLKKYDLIHANTGLAGFAIAKSTRNGPKLVYTCHNPEWTSERVHWGEKVIRKIESYNMRRSNAVIALNDTMKRALNEKAHVPLQRLFLIPNGVDTNFFRPALQSDIIDRKYGLEGKRVILYVGKVSHIKRAQVLLKSYKILLESYRYRNLKLLIVGPLSDQFTKQSINWYARQVMRWACNNLPSDSYAFTGAVSKEELRMIYSRAYVLVLPSFAEAFGMVLLEAMASACPVIGSASGGIVDVISNGVNGYLFGTGDALDLASKIDMLLSNESLRKSLGLNSRRIATEVYDWRVIAKKLMALYERLLHCDQDEQEVEHNPNLQLPSS